MLFYRRDIVRNHLANFFAQTARLLEKDISHELKLSQIFVHSIEVGV